MNECFYYLLAVDCILRRCTIPIDILTYLRMKSYITYINTYLPYLPTFPYLIVYSAIVKEGKEKEKRVGKERRH